jgi:putative oxidoreductase
MNLLKKLIKPVLMPYWWQDVLLLLPRIYCGYLLAFSFGSAKFGMPWTPADKNLGLFEVAFWFPNDVAEYGGIFKMMPAFFAWMGAFSEAVGGLFLILGLKTRLFAFLNVCTMLVAVFIQQAGQGWNQLPALGFLWVAIFYMVAGSGRFGIDYIISKKLSK